MSKPISEVIRIRKIHDRVIYTKDNELYILVRLIRVEHDDVNIAFASFLQSMPYPMRCILYKKQVNFASYETYFAKQLKENISSPYIQSLLAYMHQMKSLLKTLSQYNIVLLVHIQKISDVDHFLHVSHHIGMVVEVYEEKEIHFFFNSLFI